MKKIFTGEEQAKDTFICTLVKLFDLEKYDLMERFCDEVEITFSVLNERQVKSNEYFEFLNSIKFDLMEECRNCVDVNKDKMNFEMQNVDAMDMDIVPKESLSNISKLLEEAYTVEPSDSDTFSNPVFNTNFYMVYLLVLIINNEMDSARYLCRRLPKPVLNNRTITFIKVFLSSLLKKDVGTALSLLNKEIEGEIKKVGESTEKEECLIEEEVIEKDDKTMSLKNKNTQDKGKEPNTEEDDEKMDVYLSDKSSEVSKVDKGKKEGKNIADNTPEQSSDTIGNAVPQTQVETPEETMRDVDYDKEEEDNNDSDDDEDDDDDDDGDEDDDDEEEDEEDDDDSDGVDNDEKNNVTQLKINQETLKVGDNTMTPVDTHTPLSIAEAPVASSSLFSTRKTYFKIKRCSLFIKELLVCLLEKTRLRQISLMSKAYDHILIKEAARNLDFTEEKAISYLTNKYGWEVDTQNAMFMPKREVKERKQEMSINHINTLIDHLIFLEGSDKLQKVERF